MVKQVLIVNMDTPMSIGRLFAQVAHASIQVFLNRGKWSDNNFQIDNVSESMKYWMKESFTKVICKAWGKDELQSLYDKAIEKGIPASIIEDDGFITAVGIGPDDSKNINPITRDLALL
jgi:peptidyl-tRNA hydrolase, PTH2 family